MRLPVRRLNSASTSFTPRGGSGDWARYSVSIMKPTCQACVAQFEREVQRAPGMIQRRTVRTLGPVEAAQGVMQLGADCGRLVGLAQFFQQSFTQRNTLFDLLRRFVDIGRARQLPPGQFPDHLGLFFGRR